MSPLSEVFAAFGEPSSDVAVLAPGSTAIVRRVAQRHCRATSVRTLRPACLLRPPTILHPREILILRLPVWTPRINIKTSDSRRVTTTARGKTGTYRRNALRLPSIRTPRKIAR